MEYFSRRFPEIGPLETRCLVIGPGPTGMKAGKYAFLERYCDEFDCDCRKVLIDVVDEADPNSILGRINFGWESKEFYNRKFSSVKDAGIELTAGALDPLGQQSELADAFLDLFQELLIPDKEYVKRLERHYWMVKRSLRPIVSNPGRKRKWSKR